jgi:hypothetical protein
MKRNAWEFNYLASELREAAILKRDFHQKRLEWWNNKQTEVRELIKAEGIEIDESVSNIISNSYRQPTVQVRTDLVRDIQECIGKVSEHRGKVEEYSGWVTVLTAASPTAVYPLTHDDWLFFFRPVSA